MTKMRLNTGMKNGKEMKMNELKYLRPRKSAEIAITEQIVQVKTDEIRPNRAQPRADFNQNSIIRLADSIRRYGILQPLTVRETDPDDSYRYEIIAGERRLRAAKMLGYLTVPCIIKVADAQTSAELAIIENLLREDLNMFEEAYGFKKLIENHGLTQDEVARRMSISQSAVANKLRLLRFSYEEQKMMLENSFSERHARAIIRISGQADRLAVIKFVIEHKLNVSETEAYVEGLLNGDGGKTAAEMPVGSGRSLSTDISDTIASIRRKVDKWVGGGKNAEISVNNGSERVEINIKLFK